MTPHGIQETPARPDISTSDVVMQDAHSITPPPPLLPWDDNIPPYEERLDSAHAHLRSVAQALSDQKVHAPPL